MYQHTHLDHPHDGPITLIAATSRAHARAIVQATNRKHPAAPSTAWVATPDFLTYSIACKAENESKVFGVMATLDATNAIQAGLDAIERNYTVA